MQLAAIVHRHTTVADLCHHAKMASSLRQGVNTVDQTAVVEHRSRNILLTGRTYMVTRMGETNMEFESVQVQRILRRKVVMNAAAMILPAIASDTLRRPLQNRSVPKGALERIEVLTLRARKKFLGNAGSTTS